VFGCVRFLTPEETPNDNRQAITVFEKSLLKDAYFLTSNHAHTSNETPLPAPIWAVDACKNYFFSCSNQTT
jgi:hypothetical protein